MQENLLNNLKYAAGLIHKTSDLMQKISQLQSQFKQRKLFFKEKPNHILHAVLIILLSGMVIDWTPINLPLKIILGNFIGDGMLVHIIFLWGIPGSIVFCLLLKYMNRNCKEENQKIDAYNLDLNKNIDFLLQELAKVQNEYAKNCASWYPKNYCCVAAVDSFIYNLENYRAENLKEAVNLYEEELHRRRMENSQKQIIGSQNAMLNNQRQMLQQQNYANILAASSLNQQRNANAQLADLRDRVNNLRMDVYVQN